ncbi:helix-turn-helix domain-containing protein [Streptomyces sp. NBC_01260]|uniref:helix-turn-helix domain-containing protein n=1 Tax=unclassified Streptomyces TaxID=2593676 RepID=UPI002E338D1F|nr:helix-turn-helix domain-containing protein [Streptomyces sp. NBC_01260]
MGDVRRTARHHPIKFSSRRRARGKVGGRPSVVNDDLIRAARDMLPNPENSVTTIAKILGVSVGTLYNHIPDLKELRTSRVPRQLEGSK